jgi:hypothetical protein
MIGLAMMLAVAATPQRPKLSKREIDAISKRCATPKRWVRQNRGGVYLDTGPNAKYRQIGCVVFELQRRHIRLTGFVGNER